MFHIAYSPVSFVVRLEAMLAESDGTGKKCVFPPPLSSSSDHLGLYPIVYGCFSSCSGFHVDTFVAEYFLALSILHSEWQFSVRFRSSRIDLSPICLVVEILLGLPGGWPASLVPCVPPLAFLPPIIGDALLRPYLHHLSPGSRSLVTLTHSLSGGGIVISGTNWSSSTYHSHGDGGAGLAMVVG